MTESTLFISTLAEASLEVAALFHARVSTRSEYEPLIDADDEAITDITDDVVMVLSA